MVKKGKKGKKSKGDIYAGLMDRANESYERRDDTGRFGHYFKKDSNIKLWNPSDKAEYTIDIIPYIAGKHDPNVAKGSAAYVLDLWVHKNIGSNEDSYVCLSRNFNQQCPLCEKTKQLYDDGRNDDGYNVKAKRRNVYNVIVRDDGKEEKKGVQQLEISHHFMEKHIAKISRTKKHGKIMVAHPELGRSITFERTGTGPTNTSFEGHRLEERDEEITKKDLKAALCLDDCIVIPKYEDLLEIAFSDTVREDSDEDDLEDDVPLDYDEDEDDDDLEDDLEDNDDEEEEEDEDDEPEPPKKKKKKSSKKKSKNKCPEDDGEFGVDTDLFDECEECDLYDDCYDEKVARRKKKKKKKGKK